MKRIPDPRHFIDIILLFQEKRGEQELLEIEKDRLRGERDQVCHTEWTIITEKTYLDQRHEMK